MAKNVQMTDRHCDTCFPLLSIKYSVNQSKFTKSKENIPHLFKKIYIDTNTNKAVPSKTKVIQVIALNISK